MMQLYYSPTSPFARKVRVAILELNIQEQLELIEIDPWTDSNLRNLNPLAKVPALVLNHKEVLFESVLICEYLGSLKETRKIYPTERVGYFKSLRLQALADGAMTAMGRLYAELQKPPAVQDAYMVQRFKDAKNSALDWLEQHFDNFSEKFQIGEIAVACLLAYISFRFPEADWKAGHSNLATWFQQIETRLSMQATRYHLIAQ